MIVQPSQRLMFDFWALMPMISERIVDGVSDGYLKFKDEIGLDLRLPDPKSLSLLNSYRAVFEFPKNSEDLATCVLSFAYDTPYVILLVGSPDGLGHYRWRGWCPCTRAFSQILRYDPASQLFVSGKAFHRRINPALERGAQLQSIVEKVKEKYGWFDQADYKTFPFVKGDKDLPGISDLRELLLIDAVWIRSGLPRAVLQEDGEVDVFATTQNARTRYLHPPALLKKNKSVKARPPFKTMKEMLVRMRELGIPIPPHLRKQANELLGLNLQIE